jgi:uncharacterized protein
MRAMSNKLPRIIDPVYCTQHEKEYVVSVPQSQFLRLVEQVSSAENNVLVEARFFRNKQLRLPALDLKLKTTLLLKCQRSLDTFEHEVEVELTGVFVDSISGVNEIPDSIEVYEIVDDEVLLLELIEDELLLDIPLSPVDDSAVMGYENTEPEFEEQSSEENMKKENPFAALSALQKGH